MDVSTQSELGTLIEAVAHDMGFLHWALIHHDDLRIPKPDQINIKDYPAAVTDRLIGQGKYRRDPIIRGCLFAGSAFLWSEIHQIIQLDRHDRASFEFGLSAGLNEGITVPSFFRAGEYMGSCTFAGTRQPGRAERYVGSVQLIGSFAFQAARRLVLPLTLMPVPRLHPRQRDCVVLIGRGYSNKKIARALNLSPKTVDGYITQVCKLFNAHGRTELVICAMLAGEIELSELRRSRSG